MFPPKFFPRTIYAEPIHLRFQMSDLISSTPSPSITSLPVSASVRAAASTSDTGRFQISDLISRSASISVYSQSVSLNTSATTSTSVAENNGFRHNGSGQNESGRNESGRNKSGALPTAVKVGIALGIPLALLLLSGLAVAGSLIWKRKRGSSATAGMVSTVSQGEKADYPEQAHAGGSPQCPEVDTEDGLQTSELPASERQIYELPALVH